MGLLIITDTTPVNLGLHKSKNKNLVPWMINSTHIHSDAGTEFHSDTFRKWYSENKIYFTSAAPKHQE